MSWHPRRSSTLIMGFLIAVAACDTVPLLAPTGSTIVLIADRPTVTVNADITLVAVVSEASGTPVHDGTRVTFVTSLGAVSPAETTTHGGRAVAQLSAGPTAGTAVVTAVSGTAVSGTLELTIEP